MSDVKKTKITVETERLVVRTVSLIEYACYGCQKDTAMVTLQEAVLITGWDATAVQRLIDDGTLHSRSEADGSAFICFKSLVALQPSQFSNIEKEDNK